MDLIRNTLEALMHEEVPIASQPDHGDIEASRDWYRGTGAMPQARHQ